MAHQARSAQRVDVPPALWADLTFGWLTTSLAAPGAFLGYGPSSFATSPFGYALSNSNAPRGEVGSAIAGLTWYFTIQFSAPPSPRGWAFHCYATSGGCAFLVNSGLYRYFQNDSVADTITLAFSLNTAAGQIHRFAIVHTPLLSIYLNGALQSTMTPAILWAQPDQFTVGYRTGSGGGGVQEVMSSAVVRDLYLFDRNLSAAEIGLLEREQLR